MPENDLVKSFRQFMKQEANRGLGDIPLRATAALAPISQAQMDAAANLLNKALAALEVGDEARARRFVDRAVTLPWDEHEETHPAAMMAHQQMYDAVTDALEHGGVEWLDAATDTMPSAPEEARYCLRDALTATLSAYELTDDEKRRVRRLTQGIPPRAELPDLDFSPEQLAAAIVDVLNGVTQYLDAYDETIASTRGED